jgi:helix-turn-helix protein
MDRATLETWLAEGLSLETMGELAGRHPSTISYWLRKHGLAPAKRDRHAARGDIARETLEALVAQDLTTREIAAELDRSQSNVRYWLRCHGLRVVRARGVSIATTASVGDIVQGDCPKHGPGPFVRRRDGAWRCLRCRSLAVSARRRRVKSVLVAEAGGRCVICGYDRHPGALQFHHVEPALKSFDLGRVGVALSLERARAEASKCALLCANCHAEVENGDATLPS